MLDKLAAIEAKYSQIEARLAAPETYGDPAQVAKLNKEQNELAPVVETYRQYLRAQAQKEESEALLSDPEMKELAQEEFHQAKADLERLEQELQILLLPKDPNDGKNVIMEIRAGVGGEEAALFAHSLYRMYSMYAESRRWKTEINSVNETELGGVKEISFTIEGEGVYSRLKFESGVHRVQRVPETESGGRVHTSTATVAVRPRRRCGSFTSPPAWWWSASRSAASSRTGTRPCASWPPGCTRRNRRRSPGSSPPSGAARWAPACATSASAPITSLRAG